MESLQNKINERATRKLKDDLGVLDNLQNAEGSKYYYLMKDIKINIGTVEKPIMINPTCVFDRSYYVYKQAFEKNLPIYIKNETELFLAEIEQLKEKVSALEENVGDLFDNVQ